MFGLGLWELSIIMLVVVLVFGVGRLPELGSGLGEGIKNFRKSYQEIKTVGKTPCPQETESDDLRSAKG